nr:MAG TPA: hypothetical protein [Bacteriophage sp.]
MILKDNTPYGFMIYSIFQIIFPFNIHIFYIA